MANLSSVVVPTKALKDGRHKVRISVAHNAETRYIVTDIIIDSLKEFKNGVIVKRPDAAYLNTKLRGLLQRYQETLDELEYVNGLTCPELVYQLKNAGNYKNRTLDSIFEEFISNSTAAQSSLNLYKIYWKLMKGFLDTKMLAQSVNHVTIVGVQKNLVAANLSDCSIRNRLIFLKSVLNYAKKCGYVQYKVDPFARIKFQEQYIRDAWLTVDEIKSIRDFSSKRKNLRKCRDLFMLSYYLGGMNIVDMVQINFNEQKDEICYIRQKCQRKISKPVCFTIPQEAKEIIETYKGKDGFLSASKAQRNDYMHSFIYSNMKIIAKELNMPKLIFYSARKSFSQHALELGVKTDVIDYVIGHKPVNRGTSLFNYIYITPQMATEAIRTVLDNLK